MEQWISENGFYLGNALLSGVGLAFAIGAPVRIIYKSAKNWWILLWAAFFGMYFVRVLFPAPPLNISIYALYPWNIFNAVSTAASAMLWLYFHNKEQLKTQTSLIVFISVFLIVLSAGLSGFFINDSNYVIQYLAVILGWLFFVLLAWNYRKKHMATTILLLAYANLQLPAGLIGKTGLSNDFVLLLAAKLSLIGAMYHTLGIRDAK